MTGPTGPERLEAAESRSPLETLGRMETLDADLRRDVTRIKTFDHRALGSALPG